MAKILFSKKAFSAKKWVNSSGFKKITGNKNIARVIDTSKEKREFYSALQEVALKKGSTGVTMKTFKQALGKLEKAKSLSNSERYLIGKEIVGGSASSRVIHDSESVQEKPKVEMYKIYDEIMDKRKPSIIKSSPDAQKNTSTDKSNPDAQKNTSTGKSNPDAQKNANMGNLDANAQKKDNPAPAAAKVLATGVVANNLHNDQQLIVVKKDSEDSTQKNSSSVADYIKNRQNNESDTESIKDRLARIQDQKEPDKKYKKTELDI